MEDEKSNFRAYLIASVRQGIEDVDGPLENAFKVNLQASGLSEANIPDDIDALGAVLEKTFGTGSYTVRRAIAKQFYAKLGLPFEPCVGKKLNKYIAEAKQMFQNSLKSSSK